MFLRCLCKATFWFLERIGMKKIERISSALRKEGYTPRKLKDLPEIKHLSLAGKMVRVGALCRFVIAEDSRPSGHISEVTLCANCEYVTATIREVGTGATWMQAHYPTIFTFMERFCFKRENGLPSKKDNLCKKVYDTLEIATKEAAAWAEKRITDQDAMYSQTIYFGL